eukprot:265356-Chlamydomonas_euryale.AAC.2
MRGAADRPVGERTGMMMGGCVGAAFKQTRTGGSPPPVVAPPAPHLWSRPQPHTCGRAHSPTPV